MNTTKEYMSRPLMHSFTMPCSNTERNVRIVTRACEMRHEEIQNKMLKEGLSGDLFKFEVEGGMDNVRVNLYNGTVKDAVMIGYNFCSLQMNPGWI